MAAAVEVCGGEQEGGGGQDRCADQLVNPKAPDQPAEDRRPDTRQSLATQFFRSKYLGVKPSRRCRRREVGQPVYEGSYSRRSGATAALRTCRFESWPSGTISACG